jgi:hypothetical protein
MWEDPIVREVRANRDKLAAKDGYDTGKMFQRQKRVLVRWKGRVLSKEQLDRERGKTRSLRT